jgi:hypothetical protein
MMVGQRSRLLQIGLEALRPYHRLARLCELRNAIVHGDVISDDLWTHEGHHHLDHAHDRLIACLLAALAAETGDAMLRLRGSERVWAQRTEELARLLRERRSEQAETDRADWPLSRSHCHGRRSTRR